MVAASLLVPQLVYSATHSSVYQTDCDFFLQLIGAKKVGFGALGSEFVHESRKSFYDASGYKNCSQGPQKYQDFLLLPMQKVISQHTLDAIILVYRKIEGGYTYSHTISRGYLSFCRSHIEATKHDSLENKWLSQAYFPHRILHTETIGELSHVLECGSLQLRHMIEPEQERVVANFKINGVEIWRRDYVISTCIHSTSIS